MSTARPILAIDAATTRCSVAVALPNCVLATEQMETERGQAMLLVPMIERVMAAAGLRWTDLGAIAATVGPGSFTGLRVALAAAEGLSLAAGLPTVPVTTFAALAAAVSGPCLVAIDSRRGDIYAAYVPAGGAGGVYRPEQLAGLLPAGAGPVTVIGDAAETAAAAVPRLRVAAPRFPDAGDIARLAHRLPHGPLRPLYLRPADAVIPRDGGALRP
jgi:tRNA threonylcarbamoyladenosine biosynthesis protein TsaB